MRPIHTAPMVLLFAALAATATPTGTHDTRSERDVTDVRFAADGSYTNEVDYISTALTRAGLEQLGQQAMHYDAEHDTLTIIEAETIKADGTRVKVDPARQLFDQAPAVNLNAPTLSAHRTKIAVFPGLAVGDMVHLHYRIVVREPSLPGRIDYSFFAYPGAETRDMQLTVHLPASMPLHVQAVDFDGGRVADAPEGEQKWAWHWHGKGEFVEEDDSPSAEQRYPRVLLTNRDSWEALAQDYALRAADKAAVSPALQKLADDETRGLSKRIDIARKLYEWVTRNVRYVAVTLGDGGYVPRSADEVMASRYGDCKDHATLYEALLKAKRIDADIALIDNGGLYRLPSVPIQMFNHAINYLPEFDRFVDTTNPYGSFDALDFPLEDKPTVLVHAQRLAHTPADGGFKPWGTGALFLKPDAHGDGEASSVWTLGGAFALQYRWQLDALQGAQINSFVSNALSDAHMLGNMTLNEPTADGAEEMLDTYLGAGRAKMDPKLSPIERFILRGSLDRIGTIAPGGSVVLPEPPGLSAIGAWARARLNDKPRKSEFVCSNYDLNEFVSLELPAGVVPAKLPEDIDLREGRLHYTAKYALDGQRLTVERSFARERPNRLCPPQEENRYRDIARRIDQDLRTVVDFKQLVP